MLEQKDVQPLPDNIAGLICVVHPKKMGKRYQHPEFQLFLVLGGFGADAGNLGSKVYGRHLADGEECNFRRNDFIGYVSQAVADEILANKVGPDPFDPEDFCYIAAGAGGFAKADTLALAQARCLMEGVEPQVGVHCHRESYVNEMGYLMCPGGAMKHEIVWQAGVEIH